MYFKAINKGVKSQYFFFLPGFPGAPLRTLLIKRIRMREIKHKQVKKVPYLFYNPWPTLHLVSQVDFKQGKLSLLRGELEM